MLSTYLDLTEQINQTGTVVIDVSNYDYCLIQPIGASVTTLSTIDSGAVQGETFGNASTATNFVQIVSLDLSDGITLTTTISSGGINKLPVVGRFIKIEANGNLDKLLVMLAKIF